MNPRILLGTGKNKLSSSRVMRTMMSLLPRKGLGYRRKEFKTPMIQDKKSSSKVKPLKFKF